MTWQLDAVSQAIPDLDFVTPISDCPAPLLEYQAYYQLNLEDRVPGVFHHVGRFQCDEFDIVAHVFKVQNAKGTVFLHHGYYDHVGLFHHVIAHCLTQGFNVFTYDLPGHGLSSGERAAIQCFQQYDKVFVAALEKMQQHLPGPYVAMGQSTGGAVIINYHLSRGLSRHTSPFQAIHLLAPLVRPVSWRSAKLTYFLVRPFIKQLKRTFAKNSNDHAFLEFLSQRDPLQPLFLKTNWVGALHLWIKFIEQCAPVDLDIHVIQGTQDGTVDYRHNLKVLEEKFSGFHVHFIEGGRHHLANEDPQYLNQVIEYLTPLI